MWLIVLQRITLEFIIDLFYFPIWWYTKGARRSLLFCIYLFQDGNVYLAPGLWFKNIFVPMFGQTDWQGRLMSVFMRMVNVISRSIGLFIWFFAMVILFFVWLFLPAIVIYMLITSFMLV